MLKSLKNRLFLFALKKWKQKKKRSVVLTTDHALNTVQKILRSSRYCFFISHGESKWSSARLVQQILDDDGFVLWISTSADKRKVREVQKDEHVTVAFQNTRDDAYAALYGIAQIENSETERKRRWKKEWLLFYPDGPTADDYVLIKFVPSHIEVISFARNLVPEPFGLKPAILIKKNNSWELESPEK